MTEPCDMQGSVILSGASARRPPGPHASAGDATPEDIPERLLVLRNGRRFHAIHELSGNLLVNIFLAAIWA